MNENCTLQSCSKVIHKCLWFVVVVVVVDRLEKGEENDILYFTFSRIELPCMNVLIAKTAVDMKYLTVVLYSICSLYHSSFGTQFHKSGLVNVKQVFTQIGIASRLSETNVDLVQ